MVGSRGRESFGGQIKVQSITHIHRHCVCTSMRTYTHIYMRMYLPHWQNVKGACTTVQRADSTGILLYSEIKQCPAGHIIQMS